MLLFFFYLDGWTRFKSFLKKFKRNKNKSKIYLLNCYKSYFSNIHFI